jgi:hypothetical protein
VLSSWLSAQYVVSHINPDNYNSEGRNIYFNILAQSSNVDGFTPRLSGEMVAHEILILVTRIYLPAWLSCNQNILVLGSSGIYTYTVSVYVKQGKIVLSNGLSLKVH